MSAATDRELALQERRVTLLLHPGTDAQRALRVCDGDRLDQRARALQEAYSKHGAGADLAWLSHKTGKTTTVERNQP